MQSPSTLRQSNLANAHAFATSLLEFLRAACPESELVTAARRLLAMIEVEVERCR